MSGASNVADIGRQLRVFEFFRRQRHDGVSAAVIGIFHDHGAGIAGIGLGHAPGDVVGLTAGIDEDADVKTFRQCGRQPLAIIENGFVKITGVGVQECRLAGHRRGHMRMAMPHMGNVVIGIEIGPAFGIVEPHPLTADQMKRLAI